MAILEVPVPELSESVSEGTLLSWHKKVGEVVSRDENLIDIETDKVVLELPAPAKGVIVEILKKDGSIVLSGEVIARIDTEASASVEIKTTESENLVLNDSGKIGEEKPQKIMMPAAAKLISENEISLSSVKGTGKNGRVTKGDVLSILNKNTEKNISKNIGSLANSNENITSISDYGDRPVQRVPMSRLRARIAERLLQSQSSNAILTTFNEVNMQPVIDLRSKYKDKFEKEHGVKMGYMSFFVKAAVAALRKYPILNASIDGNDVVYHGFFDIGIAVGSPRGLVVPILKNTDQMTFSEIEKKVVEFSSKARDSKLTIDDLTGGTFSISNGGVFGSMLSTPIINPPQSAILGIHATKDRVVVINGEMVIRPMNYLTLSYDHRLIDGREAVLGLVAIKEALEDPARIMLDL